MHREAQLELSMTRRALESGIADGLHLGGQLYVSLRGAGSLDLAFGERLPGAAMRSDTPMIWLSSTKPVAAVAIARLWEEGRLELDDPVVRFVPEFGARGKSGITLRHILTHTGGFRLLATGWPEASWDEIVAAICRAPPDPRWAPGERAGYHLTSSWFILGEVVRRVDGRHFRDYARQELFEPLGMNGSWIGMPRERYLDERERLGRMYDTTSGTPRPRSWHLEPHVVGCSPGGNGYGPIRELGRFYEMLLARGRFRGRQILTPQTVEALTARHRVGMLDETFRRPLDWGLGFIVSSSARDDDLPPYGYGRRASRRTFGHSGFQSSTAFADPQHGLVVALVVNGTCGEPRHSERFRDAAEAVYDDLGLGRRGEG